MDALAHDLRFALRSILARPSFSLMAIATLALGIGANTAMFSIVNTVLLRPLPFEEPERLAAIRERAEVGSEGWMSVSPGNFLEWQQTSTSFEAMGAYMTRTATVAADAGPTEAERITLCWCSGNTFETLRVPPALGRHFRADEDRYGAPRVALISFDIWQRHFGGSPGVLGKAIRLDNEAYEIVGVAPRTFAYPDRRVQVWVPLLAALPPQQQLRRDLHFLEVVGRLGPGVSVQQAQTEISGILARYKAAHPSVASGAEASVDGLHSSLVREARQPLIVLFGAVGCLLLIACLNIANLMLTRAVGRTREIGIRAALGASRGRIVRQFITESVLLGLIGGCAGAVLASWIARVLIVRAPGVEALLSEGTGPIDGPVLLFAVALAVASGVTVGLFPALRSSRTSLTTDLRETGRGSVGNRGHRRFRDVLIAAEVGLSLVLLTVAGLLIHSFSRLYDVQPGVRTENVITMNTSLAGPGYREAARRSETLAALGDRLSGVPGVRSEGLASCAPLTGQCNALFFYVDGRPYVLGKYYAALERSVDPGYFEAAGIPLLRGRTFAREDGVGRDPRNPRTGAIVISESMARGLFAGEDPIGKRIFFDFEVQRERIEGIPAARHEIVGIVGDVLPAVDGDNIPTMYRPMLDVASRNVTIVLHTAIDPKSVVAAVREEIRRLDPTLSLFQIRTMDEIMGQSRSGRQFTMLLVVAFAALAALLSAVGLYGIVAYAVSQRTTEIGLRMALGATEGDVSRMMLMQGIRPALIGMALGLVAAVFATGLVRGLLFGVSPIDPLTFALVPAFLLVLATLACYIPARRATRLDPTVALRGE